MAQKKSAVRYSQRQAEAKAAAAAKKKNRIIVIVVAFIVVALIPVGVVLSQTVGQDPTTVPTSSDPNPNNPETSNPATQPSEPAMLIPPNGSQEMGWIAITSPNMKPDAIIVDEHLDYQCGHCQAANSTLGALFEELAARGDINLRIHMRTFMDPKLGTSISIPTSVGSVCADTIGKFAEYHELAFRTAAESGLTGEAQQLREDFPAQLGITGTDLTTFQSCFDQESTKPYVLAMEDVNFNSRTINGGDQDPPGGTPSWFVNSHPMLMSDILGINEAQTGYVALYPTADEFLAYLKKVAAGEEATPTAQPS